KANTAPAAVQAMNPTQPGLRRVSLRQTASPAAITDTYFKDCRVVAAPVEGIWICATCFEDFRAASAWRLPADGRADEAARGACDRIGVDSCRREKLGRLPGMRQLPNGQLDHTSVRLPLGERLQHRVAQTALRPVVLDGDD